MDLDTRILDDIVVRLMAPPAQQIDSGTIVFSDPQLFFFAGLHHAHVAASPAGYVGTFSLGNVDQTAQSVRWSFVADNSALQFLSANQIVAQTYAVTISDDFGGSDTENVTVDCTASTTRCRSAAMAAMRYQSA